MRLSSYITLVLLTLSVFGCRAPEVLDPLEPETLEEKDCTFTPVHFEGNSLIIAQGSLPRLRHQATLYN